MGALALLLARDIHGHKLSLTALCGASDGQDGCSGLSGAIVDENTVHQGVEAGMSIEQYITAADSATYLHRIGAGLAARKTGTNVADIVIIFKPSAPV